MRITISPYHKCRASGLALALALIAAPSLAVDVGPVAIHGALSATTAYSDRFDYLGNTGENLSINTVELTANANYRFANGLRVSAQAYGYRFGDYESAALDFASLDYSVSEWLGVRAGRIKQAWGLYGESQDVDLIRPFAFLPLDFYPKAARAMNAGLDGASLYGSVSLGGAGNLEYQVFGGWILPFDPENPYFRSTNEALPVENTEQSGEELMGTWLAWNAAGTGLRVGLSYSSYADVESTGPVKSAAELALAPSDLRLSPLRLPPGAWDGLIAGRPGSVSTDATLAAAFTEYTRGDWVFVAEFLNYDFDTVITLPVAGTATFPRRSQLWYVMGSWQATSRVQLGAYYAASYANRNDRDGSSNVITPTHRVRQKDATVAAAFAVTDWWTLKGEVHLFDGTKLLDAAGNGDMLSWKPHWTYLVVKSTFMF